MSLIQLYNTMHDQLEKTRLIEGLAPLLLRIYLAPIFILAGYGKLSGFDNTVYFFGEHLGLPFPTLMAALAGTTEFVGGWLLLIGLGTRWITLPLMMTMAVAAVTAHWQFGWHAFTRVNPDDALGMAYGFDC